MGSVLTSPFSPSTSRDHLSVSDKDQMSVTMSASMDGGLTRANQEISFQGAHEAFSVFCRRNHRDFFA